MSRGCVDADVAAAFAAGLLEGDELSEIEVHIDGCAACRRVLSEAARAMSAGSAPGEAPASEGAGAPPTHASEWLTPGAKIGRFVIDGPLGAGAMGVVAAAHDPELGRRVALKAMRSGALPGGQSAERLLRREAKAMAQLSHPNVVAVYDLLVERDLVFVAMELVEGVTLRRWLREKPRGGREIVDVFAQAGRGLAAAHGVGIVHRDFKPENVLCGSDGRVCVTDFGLSRLAADGAGAVSPSPAVASPAGSTSVSAAIAGTPRYMAPEQRAGRPATAKSDQFSFCVALYEALHGEHPFASTTRGSGGKAADPPSVPRRVRACLRRGLREDAEARFPSMDALLAALSHSAGAGWRTAVAATLAVAVLASAGLVGHRAERARRAACSDARAGIGDVWNAERRRAVSSAFAAVRSPYTTGIEPRVEAGVDRYVAQWTAAWSQSCAAVARVDPAAVDGDPQLQCLAQRRRELGAVVGELDAVAGTEDAASGVIALESLPVPEACTRGAEVRVYAKGAVAPANAALAESVRSDLARVDALIYFHKHAQAATVAERARDEARTLGDATLIGQTLLRCGYAHASIGQAAVALRELYDAIAAADSSGDDATRARAFAHLLFFVPKGEIDAAQAPLLFEQGLAAVSRLGGDDALEAHLRMNYGFGLWTHHDLPEARDQLEKAIALLRRGGHRMPLTDALSELALVYGSQGDYGGSVRTFEEALDNAREVLGDQHPIVASVLSNIASVFIEYRQPDRALDATRRAVAINDATRPERPGAMDAMSTEAEALLELGRYDEALPIFVRGVAASPPGMLKGWNAQAATNLGRTYVALHRSEEALAPLERALAGNPEPEYAADARFALARALTDLHRDAPRAGALAREARDGYDAMAQLTPLQRAKREEIVAWVASAGASSTEASR